MVKIIEPKLPNQLNDSTTFPKDEEMMIQHTRFQHLTLTEEYYRYTIKKCTFEYCDFTASHFQQLELQDVVFKHCDLSNIEWIGTSLQRIHFIDCKLFGMNFAESYLQDCLFQNCLADYSSFHFAKIKNLLIEQCSNQFSEFSEIDWKNFVLTKTNLSDSQWLHTSLNQLNLSSCHFEKITFSPDKIKGLILNQEQALIIAMSLGIKIEDGY